MIIESEEMIHIIYKIFLPYIEEHPYFDIVYSKKIGFVKLWISESRDEMSRIGTWEELLESLCREIALDVIVCNGRKKRISEMIDESCLRIEKLLNPIEQNRAELMEWARSFVCSYLQRNEP